MNFFALYIDPGTGSMLFSLFIALAATVVFAARALLLKLKFIFSGGKAASDAARNKIPYVIFSDHKRYWNVFKPICDEFERCGVPLAYWTASPDDPALTEKYNVVKAEFIGEGNKAFARLNMMNAGIVLSTTPGLDVYQWKRSRNVDWYVHILHMANDATTYRMFGLDFYDAVICSGNFQTEQIRTIERMRSLPQKELVVAGCTYLDSMKAKLDSLGGSAKKDGKKTVLLAPSWGESGILSRYGEKIIAALVKTGYSVVIRPHPQSFMSEKPLMDRLMEKYPETESLKWNRDNDNFSALDESDILITDFSGIIFDYALVFGKPVIFADTSFNSAPYDAAWISEPLWTFSALEKIGVPLREDDFPRIKEVIDGAIESKSLEAGREFVRNECWQNMLRSAELTADYLIQKQHELQTEIAPSKEAV